MMASSPSSMKGLGDDVEDMLAPVGDEDILDTEPVRPRDGLAQFQHRRVGVHVDAGEFALHGLYRERRGAEGILVGREFLDPLEPEFALHVLDGFARRIWFDECEFLSEYRIVHRIVHR